MPLSCTAAAAVAGANGGAMRTSCVACGGPSPGGQRSRAHSLLPTNGPSTAACLGAQQAPQTSGEGVGGGVGGGGEPFLSCCCCSCCLPFLFCCFSCLPILFWCPAAAVAAAAEAVAAAAAVLEATRLEPNWLES